MKEEKKSRKEEEKKDPYDRLTESLMRKGGLVSAMISVQPRTEELKTERMEERKSEKSSSSSGREGRRREES